MGNKVSGISNEMLIELRKKKYEVLGESLEKLVPVELVSFVEEAYGRMFDGLAESEKTVLPFLDVKQQIVPLRV